MRKDKCISEKETQMDVTNVSYTDVKVKMCGWDLVEI